MDMIEILDYRHGAKIPTRRRIKATQVRGLMRVTSKIIHSCIYVGYFGDKGDTIAGTAFAINFPIDGLEDRAHALFITAKHCIEETPGEVVKLRFNLHNGGSEWVPTQKTDWAHHLDTDISMYHWREERDGFLEKFRFYSIPESMFAAETIRKEYDIGIGDEVLSVGLFTRHAGKHENHPIVRVGNISALPTDKIHTKKSGLIEGFLIELRSIGGLSGSPVFVHLGGLPGPHRPKNSLLVGKPLEDPPSIRTLRRNPYDIEDVIYLLGVMHGHFDLDKKALGDIVGEEKESEQLNTGIGVVMPIDHVLELLQTDSIKDSLEIELEEELSRVSTTMDSTTTEEGPSKEQFEEALRKASKPTSSPPSQGKKGT